MVNKFFPIFHRPNTTIWATMITTWIEYTFLMMSNLVWFVAAYTFEWPTWKDPDPHNMTAQCGKKSKQSTSEWHKWKHVCQDMLDNHDTRFLYRHTIRSLNKAVLKLASVSHRLIVGWGDALLGYLSTGKRKQRRYLCKRHRAYSNSRLCKNINRSWIPPYLLSQSLVACATTPTDRKSTRLNSSHPSISRMPSSA